ncbi:MAG TPA: N-acetyl-gamma-glutamyl-phosphate reductase [Acidimicrobiales bacterium]|nr:N-acetyl-gamma-glutamyl-phosphate reductase [Acidimicrobiales bacterium]
MSSRLPVAVLGASGYAGAELMRLLAGHPHLEVAVATGATAVGGSVADAYPNLAAAYPDLTYGPTTPAAAEGAAVVFLALPHGASQDLVPALRAGAPDRLVVDLAADFRLRDPALYPAWYGEEHRHPELLAEAVHGIPELGRDGLRTTRLVAAAGCYVTAAALAVAPFTRGGHAATSGVVVDAASGVSGAGVKPTAATHFGSVDGSFTAYGLLTHRHTPEIEQATGAQVLFTPHLAPMSRGILATCYLRPADGAADTDPLEVLAEAYRGEPFVVVDERIPSTKATLGSNSAHLTARRDPRTGWIVALAALDNMGKGAAGQALQCANIALGLDEGAGLTAAGTWP